MKKKNYSNKQITQCRSLGLPWYNVFPNMVQIIGGNFGIVIN